MSKKKRVRRKKCRRKVGLTADQKTKLTKSSSKWSMPMVYEIIHRAYVSPKCQQRLELKSLKSPSLKIFDEHSVELTRSLNEQCVVDASKFLSTIQRNFAKFRLGRVLNDTLPSGRTASPAKLINMFATPKQLHAFLERLFSLVFPVDFLGAENWRQLIRNFTKILTRLKLRNELASFLDVFQHIRISEIKWLRNLPFALKMQFSKNILHYLTTIVANVICICFYSTLNSSGQIVHYRRGVWNAITQRAFAIISVQRKFKVIDEKPEKITPIHRLRFLPKKNDVRPLVLFKDNKVKRELAEVRAILTFIVDKNPQIFGCGIRNLRLFSVNYRKLLVNLKHGKNVGKVFWCTMDLANCFTTIKHDLLEKILSDLIPTSMKFTVVQRLVKNTKVKCFYPVRAAGANYLGALARLQTKNHEEFILNTSTVELTGAEVMSRVRRFVLRTIIEHNGRLYRCERGIAQGNPLSVILCNIYLGSMERTLFPQPLREIFCKRYIDDYIMISPKKAKIVEIIKTIENEKAHFGVQLNSKKIFTSFSDDALCGVKRLKSNRKIQWCGYAFNTRTLYISVDYQRYRGSLPRCTINPKPRLTDRLQFICTATKRLLKGRYMAIRGCVRALSATQRKSFRADFCRFTYRFYFRYFIRQFRLDLRDKQIHVFFSQMLRWISNCFRKKSLPDACKLDDLL